MQNNSPNPLNRRYRQTSYDQRPKRMKVYDFTRPMTQTERTSLFSNVRRALNRAFERHDGEYLNANRTKPDHHPDQTWWQFLRSNRQQYKRFL